MNTEFGELLQSRERRTLRRRRLAMALGVVLIFLGFYLVGVRPDTSPNWALVRVCSGVISLTAGFGLAVLPLFSNREP